MDEQLQKFLDQPTANGAEEALLRVLELFQEAEPPSRQDLDPVLLACCQQGVLDGDRLELLPEPLVEPLFAICGQHLEATRAFLESQRTGPNGPRASALLEIEALPIGDAEPPADKPRDWRDDLADLRTRWAEYCSQGVDRGPLLPQIRKAFEEGLVSEAFAGSLRLSALREFSFDLSQDGQRELEGLLWNADTQEVILRRVSQTFSAKGSAQDREALLVWVLERGNEQALQQLAVILPSDDTAELVSRLQAMGRLQEAADTLFRWFDQEFPTNPKKLAHLLKSAKKGWGLRQQRPDLEQLFLTNTNRSLVQMAEQPREQLQQLFQELLEVREIGDALENSLIQTLATATVSRSDQSVLIGLLLEHCSDTQAVLRACEWSQRLPKLPATFWLKGLRDRHLPGSGDLVAMLVALTKTHHDFLGTLYTDRVGGARADLSTWISNQVSTLGQRLEGQFQELRQLLKRLGQAWQDDQALLARLAQVQDALADTPSVEEFCSVLFEELPAGPEPVSASSNDHSAVTSGYLLGHWSSWTSLSAPNADDLTGWLSTSHDCEALAELAFALITAVLEGACPESAYPELGNFLDLLVESRPDVGEYLRENAGDALQLLPFPTRLAGSSAPPPQPNGEEDLPAMARRLEAMEELKVRAQRQIDEFSREVRLYAARRLGPGLDNLEHFLLPYFHFRRQLESDFGLEPAVGGLDQRVPAEQIGERVRLAGEGDSNDAVYNNTMGLRLREDPGTAWPAYASPRPRQ